MLKQELAQLEQNNKDLQSIPKNKKRALTPFFYRTVVDKIVKICYNFDIKTVENCNFTWFKYFIYM